MSLAKLSRGQTVYWRNQAFVISEHVGPGKLKLTNIANGITIEETKERLIIALSNKDLMFANKGQDPQKINNADLHPLYERFKDEIKRRNAYVDGVQRSGAHRLTKQVLTPIIAKVAQAINDSSPPAWITVYRWMTRTKKSGSKKGLIPAHLNKGHRDRLGSEVSAIIDSVIDEYYLDSSRLSVPQIYEFVVNRIDEENKTRSEKEKLMLPSIHPIYTAIQKIDPYDVMAARYGEKVAAEHFRVSGTPERPTRILERVEIDHTPLNLIVVDEETGFAFGRPTLTTAIDVYSRLVIGFYISFHHPSVYAVFECLKNAIWPKTYLREKYPDIVNEWPAYGVPEMLVCDNGMEFGSGDFEYACMELGINPQYCPIKEPRFKGSVERFFRTISKQLFNTLPGTTFSNTKEKGDYDSASHAVISMDLLGWVVTKWVVDIYNQRKHRGAKAVPAKLWKHSLTQFEPFLPASADNLETVLGRRLERSIQRQGIQINDLFYRCDHLVHLRGSNRDNKYVVKYNPDDLGRIMLYDPEQRDWIPVYAANPEYANGLTLFQHQLNRQVAKQEYGKDDINSLAKASKMIRDQIKAQMKKRQKKSVSNQIAKYLDIGIDQPVVMLPADDEKPRVGRPKVSTSAAIAPRQKGGALSGVSDIGVKIAHGPKQGCSAKRTEKAISMLQSNSVPADDDLDVSGFSAGYNLPKKKEDKN